MGIHPREYQGQVKEPAQQVALTYELADEFLLDDDGQPDGAKPRWITETINLFNIESDKAKSTKRIMALDPNLVHGGDLTPLLGTPINVHLVKEEKKGKIYNNVSGLAPMREKEVAQCPALVNEPRLFDLDEPDMKVFNDLPNWLQEKIKGNLNFAGSKLAKSLGDKGEAAPKAEGETDDSPY
jgi:hypothetical protein